MSGPRQQGAGDLVGPELVSRVRVLCARVGHKRAALLLRSSLATVSAARAGARLRKCTVDRLVGELARVEAELGVREAS